LVDGIIFQPLPCILCSTSPHHNSNGVAVMSYYTRCIDAQAKRVSEKWAKYQELKRQDNLYTMWDTLYLMKRQWLFVFKLPGRIIKFVRGN
jgi:hypothetical protein